MNDYYVYAFFRENGEPFYIGKGRGDRWLTHFREAINRKRNSYCVNLIRGMITRGTDVPKIKLHSGLSNKQAVEYEIALIKAIGRKMHGGPLVNMTDGGEGLYGLSLESRTKHAAKVSAGKLGKKFTLEARANMSVAKKLQAQKGLIIANLGTRMLGRTHSLETKKKMSAAALGRKMESDAREKMRVAWTYRRFGPEVFAAWQKIATY